MWSYLKKIASTCGINVFCLQMEAFEYMKNKGTHL